MNKFQDEQNIIDRVVSGLLRDSNGLPIGLELLNKDIIFLNLPEDIPAFKTKDTIYLNRTSRFIKTRDFEESVTFLMLHEALHTLCFHDRRLKSKDPALWGMATDYMVDAFIVYLRDFLSKELVKYDPRRIFTGKDPFLYDPQYRGMLEEDIYEDLNKTSEVISRVTKEMLTDVNEKQQKSKQDLDGMPRLILSNISRKKDRIQRSDVEVLPNTGGGKSDKQGRFPDKNQSEEKGIKRKADQESPLAPQLNRDDDKPEILADKHTHLAKSMFEIIIKGHGTTESKRFLELLSGVKTDWKLILKDSLNRALDRSAELTWGKPRLAWLVNNHALPYLPDYADEPKRGTLVVSIDESASVSDRNVSMAIDIVCQSKERYKKVFVIKHDIDVNWTGEYETIGNDDIKELIKRKHCGGTSHKNVFKTIMRYAKAGEGNLISAYIGITDMESDIFQAQDLLPLWLPRIYLACGRKLPEGIIGKIINFM